MFNKFISKYVSCASTYHAELYDGQAGENTGGQAPQVPCTQASYKGGYYESHMTNKNIEAERN